MTLQQLRYAITIADSTSMNEAAKQCGFAAVDFPSISTGVYHFPLDKAAKIAISAIAGYMSRHPEIERVRMVCFDARTKEYYENALENLK